MAVTTGSLGALNAALAINTDSAANAAVGSAQITGTFSGTITPEASTDGVNWNAFSVYPISGGQATQAITAVGAFVFPVLGYNQIRFRMSSYTSGSATVSEDVSAGTLNLPMTPSGAGMVDSVQAGGVVTAPASGGAVVAAITPGAGTWEVTVSCGLGGAASAAADVGNLQLQKNASVLTKLCVPGSGAAVNPVVRVTLLNTDTISVNAVGAGTSGVAYSAVAVLKRVG